MTAAAQAAADQDPDVDDVTDDTSTEDTAADVQGGDSATDDGAEVDWEAKAKDLQAKYEAQQRINRNLERRTKRDKATLDKLTATGTKPADDTASADKDDKSRPDVDVDKIRAEALAQAKVEAAQEALKERVHDKIEAKAAKGFADPADAVAMLLRGHEITDFIDDGKVDVDAIQDALTELLEKKPYLGAAAQGGKNRFQGSAEGGPKTARPSRPKSLDEAVRRSFGSQ